MAEYERWNWLVHQRIKAGWTQEQAARMVGVPLKTWQAWEQGYRRPTREKLRMIKLIFPDRGGMQEG